MYSPSPQSLPGPGDFHDWVYDKWSELAHLRDASFEVFAQQFKSDLQIDANCQIFHTIDEVMKEALEAIYEDTIKSEKFIRLMFTFWQSANNFWKAKELLEMLELEVDRIIARRFKQKMDWH